MRLSRAYALSLVGALGCSSTPAPTPGPAPMPPSTTFITGNLEPMIVDWQPEQRGDLEISMHDGLVVVGYDDRGFRLLKDCHVDGTYDYMGMTRRERVVRLESADDIKANLPLGGAGLAARLGGELSKGATVDIAMVMVGKVRTTWRNVAKKDLVGQCMGASHIVRGATVGAFAVDKGDRMHARAVAEIFGFGAGGGRASSSMLRVVDGQLESCASANPDSKKAPSQCGALIRVELLPISNDASPVKAPERDPELRDTCTPPLVRVDGICKVATAAPKAECNYGNARACFESCKANVMPSCSKLALMAVRGEGGAPQAPQEAANIAKRACDGGDAPGCTLYGSLLSEGVGVPKNVPEAARRWAKACDDGDADGCMSVGTLLLAGQGIPRDTKLAAKALGKGCSGGAHGACSDLGLLALGGQGFDKDLPLAAKLFKRACDGDNSTGCSNFAYTQEFGMGTPKNVQLATAGYAKACDLDPASCTWFGAMHQLGKGVAKDDKKAVALYRRACERGDVVACSIVKVYLDPTQKLDQDRFVGYVNVWKDTCTSGVARDCSGLGVLAHAAGKPDDARNLLSRGCSLGDEWGCLMATMKPR